MSPVEFKKTPCRPVEFKGQGPQSGTAGDQNPAIIFVAPQPSLNPTSTRKHAPNQSVSGGYLFRSAWGTEGLVASRPQWRPVSCPPRVKD